MKHNISSNYQDLLKILAIITMIIDHVGRYFFPEVIILRVIGRLSMPLFCFFAGYNFHNNRPLSKLAYREEFIGDTDLRDAVYSNVHEDSSTVSTHKLPLEVEFGKRSKPKVKLILLAIGLYIYSSFLFKAYTVPNILFSIYLGQYYLYYFQKDLKTLCYEGYFHVIILALLSALSATFFEYGTLAISIMILGYIAKHDAKNLKLTVFTTMLFSITYNSINFAFPFIYIILTIITGIIGYLLMTMENFEKSININLNFISRNIVYIYCLHLMIFQFIYTQL